MNLKVTLQAFAGMAEDKTRHRDQTMSWIWQIPASQARRGGEENSPVDETAVDPRAVKSATFGIGGGSGSNMFGLRVAVLGSRAKANVFSSAKHQAGLELALHQSSRRLHCQIPLPLQAPCHRCRRPSPCSPNAKSQKPVHLSLHSDHLVRRLPVVAICISRLACPYQHKPPHLAQSVRMAGTQPGCRDNPSYAQSRA